jgi:hypothetical protein
VLDEHWSGSATEQKTGLRNWGRFSNLKIRRGGKVG